MGIGEDTTSKVGNHRAVRVWFRLVYRCRLKMGTTVTSIDYQLECHRVCAGTFAAVYAIPPTTMKKLASNVLKGDREWVTYNDTKTAQTQSDRPTLLAEATSWWQTRLR
eukprot:989254-Pleurochrysis_carterae.AAC.1